MSHHLTRFIPTLAAVCMAAAACSAIPPRPPVEPTARVDTFAVLPTEAPEESDSASGGAQLEAGALTLETLLTDRFKNRTEARLVSRDQVESVATAATGSRLMVAREIGAKLQVDGVLLSTIHRFRLRNGDEYSADQPASVAFELQLLEVDSGRVLCNLVFDETQKPLLENIFSFSRAAGRGFRWVTAEELVAEGLNKKLDSCPYLPAGSSSTP